MLADPLTKLMKSDRLVNSLDKSYLDLTPTKASVIAKAMKQRQRRKTKDDDNVLEDLDITYDQSYAEEHLPAAPDEIGYMCQEISVSAPYPTGTEAGDSTQAVSNRTLNMDSKSHECETSHPERRAIQ